MKFIIALVLLSSLVLVLSVKQVDRSDIILSRTARDAMSNASAKKRNQLRKFKKNGKKTARRRNRFRFQRPRAMTKTGPVEDPLPGADCQYVDLSNIVQKGVDCGIGDKFVLKGKRGVTRRQFLIVKDMVILAFVAKNKKFPQCTSFTEVTGKVKCKPVPGLADVNLSGNQTTAAGTTTEAATTGATTGAATTAATTVAATTGAATTSATTGAATTAATTGASTTAATTGAATTAATTGAATTAATTEAATTAATTGAATTAATTVAETTAATTGAATTVAATISG